MIYIVEDDAAIRELEQYALQSSGYEVQSFETSEPFWQAMRAAEPELVILDVMLPGEDGFSILKKLRNTPALRRLPIIMVTAKSSELDTVRGLDCGADDYITKPFGTFELLARIRTAIRHNNKIVDDPVNANRPYSAGGLKIDFEKRLVSVDGNEVHLTRVEYKIVSLLAKNSGKVMTYDSLINQVWGPYADDNNRILRVNMANIRRKLEANPGEPKFIFTELGIGYRMLEDESLA